MIACIILCENYTAKICKTGWPFTKNSHYYNIIMVFSLSLQLAILSMVATSFRGNTVYVGGEGVSMNS